eukprot:scaffold10238_cov276-Chaetoceros_neogracile.AAC.11
MFSNSKMESIRIEIFDKSGEIVYQILEVDASCKGVFATTDQFGALKVLNYSNRKQGFIGCGLGSLILQGKAGLAAVRSSLSTIEWRRAPPPPLKRSTAAPTANNTNKAPYQPQYESSPGEMAYHPQNHTLVSISIK